MADTATANYGFIKPDVGGSADTWGAKLNDNWDDVDAVLSNIAATYVTPAGAQTLTNKTLANPTVANYTEQTAGGNVSGAVSISLSNGTLQVLTLVGNATITLPAPTAGKSLVLIVKQDATGARTVTWGPSSIRWPNNTTPTVSANPNRADKFVFTADGTYWYASNGGQNFFI